MARYRDPIPSLFKRRGYYYFWYWDGDVRRLKSTGKTTTSEARRFQQSFLRNQPSSGLLSAYVSGWFVSETCPWTHLRRQSGAVISDDYLENRKGYLKRYIIPHFGNRQMGKITSTEIQSWLYGLKLANQTRKHIYTTFRDIFAYAVQQGDMSENPMDRVTVPVVSQSSSREAFTHDEAVKVIVAAESISRIAYYALWTLWASGIRSGELRGLQSQDVLSKPSEALWVRRAAKRKGVMGETKTAGSYRVVPIPQSLHHGLIEYGSDKAPDDFLFPVAKETVSWWTREAMKRCSITRKGLTAHSFRHSYVSALRGQMSDQLLRDAVGHTTVSSTERYDQRWVDQRLDSMSPVTKVVHLLWEVDPKTEQQQQQSRQRELQTQEDTQSDQ